MVDEKLTKAIENGLKHAQEEVEKYSIKCGKYSENPPYDTHGMKPVILESPFAGDFEKNIRYARDCMHDCLTNHNEAPYASHLLYTQDGILDDENPAERMLGMEAGFVWHDRADYTVVYVDLGISKGMVHGIELAKEKGQDVIFRALLGDWKEIDK